MTQSTSCGSFSRQLVRGVSPEPLIFEKDFFEEFERSEK